MTSRFQGVEFDWLRSQVQAVLWDPHAPQQVAAGADVFGVVKPTARSGKDYALRSGLIKGTDADRADYTRMITASLSPVIQARPAKMSVAEYNDWRERERRTESTPYVHQEYPCLLYRGNDAPRLATSATEHKTLLSMGWCDTPQ